MTCKDCIHYGVCACDTHFCRDNGGEVIQLQDSQAVEINCGNFKDKSRYIELPCRVGDTMYVIYKGIAYPVCVNAIRIDTKKNNHRICVSGTFHLYEDYDHNYKATFPFDSIGKSLFYTEAEAKMKGGAE